MKAITLLKMSILSTVAIVSATSFANPRTMKVRIIDNPDVMPGYNPQPTARPDVFIFEGKVIAYVNYCKFGNGEPQVRTQRAGSEWAIMGGALSIIQKYNVTITQTRNVRPGVVIADSCIPGRQAILLDCGGAIDQAQARRIRNANRFNLRDMSEVSGYNCQFKLNNQMTIDLENFVGSEAQTMVF
jgi:hypothetical protein